MKEGSLRLDKWLWHARFCKSRSLAAKLVQGGGFRVNGNLTDKAAQGVKPGDHLTFALGQHIRVIKVVALGERRGPAKEAQGLYEDLKPPEKEARLPRAGIRPTKRNRRQIDALHDKG